MTRSRAKSTTLCVALALICAAALRSDAAFSAPPFVKADVFFAQAAAGSGNGSSCGNAKSVTAFNNTANWGPAKTIAPGTVVALCGAITSSLTVEGSGTAGHRIRILFAPGARLSQPVCGPCLTMDKRSYITVDGGADGIIEATDNGTHLGHQSNSTGIRADSCNACEIENLTIRNIYVHDGSGNHTEIDQTQVRSIWANGSDVRIHNNVLHDAGWSIFFDGSSVQHEFRVYANDIYNVDHGFIVSGNSPGPIWFNNNHVHDFANWDTTSNTYHHDGIHCYTVDAGKPHHIDDFFIYNNRFDGDIGGNATAWIFIEGGTGPYATPCADSTSRIWIFNNYATLSHDSYNGAFGLFTGLNKVYNNTLIGHQTAAGTVCQFSARPGMAMQNNICATGNQLIGMSKPSDGAFAPGSPDFNVYANGGGNAFVCRDGSGLHFFNFDQFPDWKSCIGGDRHSRRVPDAKLAADGIPEAASPALAAGTTLGRLCAGHLTPLCFDIVGALRPFRMRPDAGAYQRETAAISAKAIGRVRIGASRDSVEAFYGTRPVTRSRLVLGAFPLRNVQTATYRLHGGKFAVSYANGKVVAVSTTSRYYTTTAGFGVGAPAAHRQLVTRGWHFCGTKLVRRRNGVATAIRVAGGKIAAVTLSAPAVLACR